MNDADVKKIGDLIDQKLKPLSGKIDSIQETLDSHTGSLMKIESTLVGYADMYKINKGNIERLDERMGQAEDQLDIQIPPELAIQR